jgi:hypothetical protein
MSKDVFSEIANTREYKIDSAKLVEDDNRSILDNDLKKQKDLTKSSISDKDKVFISSGIKSFQILVTISLTNKGITPSAVISTSRKSAGLDNSDSLDFSRKIIFI